MTKTLGILLIGLFILTACSSTGELVTPVTVTTSPPPTAAGTKALPTPISPGQMVVYEDLEVVMDQAEITASYLTEFGSTREPPAGKKFLWVHILLKNIGQQEQDLPESEHFSALHSTTEFKPTYGHREEHADYTDLTTSIIPGQELDAWLRFDIPDAAELQDLWFAFLPESSQVSVLFSPSTYSWGDHPIYLWACTPY
jgi:hypothetical protein